MTKFRYVAIDENNNKIKGLYMAESEESLRQALLESGLSLVACRKAGTVGGNSFFSMSLSIKQDEVTTFSRQLSIMISEGIGILESLIMLSEQEFSNGMKVVLKNLSDDVTSGKMLSEAMERHKKVFPNFFASMVRVGEASGTLDRVLIEVADYYERNAKIKKQASSALVYPIMVLIFTIVVVIGMMIFVIPNFVNVLGDMDAKLPTVTLIIFNISKFFLTYPKQIILGVLVFVFLMILIAKSKQGKVVWHTIKAKAPVFRRVTSALITAKLTSGFYLLLSSGVNIVDAMEVLSPVMDNYYYQNKFSMAVQMIKRGTSIADALKSLKIFPPTFTQMIAVGEKSGAIDEIMGRTSKHFEEEYVRALKKMTTFIEPCLLVIMAVLVGTIILAVIMPMLTMIQTVNTAA